MLLKRFGILYDADESGGGGTSDEDLLDDNDAEESGEESSGGARFTQADLDREVKLRLKREKAKFADYDDYKNKASKWDELQRESESDLQKAQADLKRAIADNQQLAKDLTEARVQIAFLTQAGKAETPIKSSRYGAALRLLDRSLIDIDEDGEISGIDDAIKALIAEMPEWAVKPSEEGKKLPDLDGRAKTGANPRGGSDDNGEALLSDEKRRKELARKYGIPL